MTVATVDLTSEAATEARRLSDARALLRDGDEHALARLEGGATWIACPRRGRLRRAWGRGVCLVWRVAFEDACGRLVESRLVPVLVEPAPRVGRVLSDPARRASLFAFVQHAETLARPRVEAACEVWAETVVRTSAAFTSARLSRELHLDRPATTADHASQPGLFDRRADRSRAAHAVAAAQAEREAAERRDEIAAGAALTRRPAQLLLVLVP